MGIPQRRQRVFFVCLRKDLSKPFLYYADMFTKIPKIELNFDEKPILLNEFEDNNGKELNKDRISYKRWLKE